MSVPRVDDFDSDAVEIRPIPGRHGRAGLRCDARDDHVGEMGAESLCFTLVSKVTRQTSCRLVARQDGETKIWAD